MHMWRSPHEPRSRERVEQVDEEGSSVSKISDVATSWSVWLELRLREGAIFGKTLGPA